MQSGRAAGNGPKLTVEALLLGNRRSIKIHGKKKLSAGRNRSGLSYPGKGGVKIKILVQQPAARLPRASGC